VIETRFKRGLTYLDIGHEMGVSRGWTQMLGDRALEKIRRRLPELVECLEDGS
jgi:DNA-directed RNA polymerase specialized sigma subunit